MANRRAARRGLILAVILLLLAGTTFWAVRNLGRWLVVSDPLQPARAIVVLSGESPYRAMEAAEVYKKGFAPEVWLTRAYERAVRQAFENLGIHYVPEEDYNVQVLERRGVPGKAIRVLSPLIRNTAEEELVIAKELREVGGDRVILVTSGLHTRRSRAIWHVLIGDHPEVILHYSPFEPSNPAQWWHSTSDADDVGHEVFGLINARLGFLAKPREQ